MYNVVRSFLIFAANETNEMETTYLATAIYLSVVTNNRFYILNFYHHDTLICPNSKTHLNKVSK